MTASHNLRIFSNAGELVHQDSAVGGESPNEEVSSQLQRQLGTTLLYADTGMTCLRAYVRGVSNHPVQLTCEFTTSSFPRIQADSTAAPQDEPDDDWTCDAVGDIDIVELANRVSRTIKRTFDSHGVTLAKPESADRLGDYSVYTAFVMDSTRAELPADAETVARAIESGNRIDITAQSYVAAVGAFRSSLVAVDRHLDDDHDLDVAVTKNGRGKGVAECDIVISLGDVSELEFTARSREALDEVRLRESRASIRESIREARARHPTAEADAIITESVAAESELKPVRRRRYLAALGAIAVVGVFLGTLLPVPNPVMVGMAAIQSIPVSPKFAAVAVSLSFVVAILGVTIIHYLVASDPIDWGELLGY